MLQSQATVVGQSSGLPLSPVSTLIAKTGSLSLEAIRMALATGLNGRFTGQKVLVLIPDHTRSLPLPTLFRLLVEILSTARQLDFMVALGTHPPLSETRLHRLIGVTAQERSAIFRHVGLLSHAWDDPAELTTIGVIGQDEIKHIAGKHWHASLPNSIPIQLNKAALAYDHILILGPTFPHEVVGFSGGAKYLFPGISGPAMINATHWLGALVGVLGTIGMSDTPVRAMIHAAAARLSTPVTLAALTVVSEAVNDTAETANTELTHRPGLAGIFIGDLAAAWQAAVELSAQHHIRWQDHPFQRVLSCPSPMYDELWTGGKAMYKLEPVIAPGGELIIYAPHLDRVSRVHGKYLFEMGYHILPYFLQNWPRYQHIPLSVLAHSTHVRGAGRMENGIERANVRVTLSSRISPEDCARLNLGYLDPASVDITEWQNREPEGVLYVPNAGEILYKLKM